jgi:hypothetical protein
VACHLRVPGTAVLHNTPERRPDTGARRHQYRLSKPKQLFIVLEASRISHAVFSLVA